MILLYGRWGSGKSTLLNFLEAKLKIKHYNVVKFNAWRHQHINPSWWPLTERIFLGNNFEITNLG